MLDDLLALGAVFDWISPGVAAIQDRLYGPSHTFYIPHACGYSGGEIAMLLRASGVKTWGHMIVNGRIMLTVRRGQAQWAQYLIERAGIPIECGARDPEPERDGHPLNARGDALHWGDLDGYGDEGTLGYWDEDLDDGDDEDPDDYAPRSLGDYVDDLLDALGLL